MLSFKDAKLLYGNKKTVGQQLKEMSDMVMQETFDNDIQTKQCYIYDYFHDDQKDKCSGYDPKYSRTKTPVKLKFIVKEYKSASKDDPEYHIQFEPNAWNSMSCKPDYFDVYEQLGIQFPIGMWCDIPDDRGVYHKWLCFYQETANQFPKIGVMKCNHKFQWITVNNNDVIKREMWGCIRTQNS